MSIRPTSLPRPSATRLPYGARLDARRFFDPDTNPTDPPTPPADPPTDPTKLGDPGKAALDVERSARKAAEKARKDAEDRLAALEDEQQKAKDKQAEEQGEFKRLAEERQAEIDRLKSAESTKVAELEAQIAQRDRDDRARAALKAANLDESLLPRLHGTTDEELKADAAELAKLIKAATPKPERGNPSNPRADGPAGEKDDEEALKAHEAAFRI